MTLTKTSPTSGAPPTRARLWQSRVAATSVSPPAGRGCRSCFSAPVSQTGPPADLAEPLTHPGGDTKGEARSQARGQGAKPPERGSRGRSPPGGGLGVRPPENMDETAEKAQAPKERGPSRRWRCRELNPGPLAYQQDFSVRSPLRLCLAPSVTRTSRGDEPSHCLLHDCSPWPGQSLSLLADAGTRAGGEPGPTETHSLRRRGRTRADWSRRLFGCDDAYGGLSPAPARFS